VATAVLALWLGWLWSSAVVAVRGLALLAAAVEYLCEQHRRATATWGATPSSWPARVVLLVWLPLTLGALLQLVGPPHLPHLERPTQAVLVSLVHDPLPSFQGLVEALGTAAWLGWLYLAGTVLFRVLVMAAVQVSHGAAWAQELWALSDRISLPLVRRGECGVRGERGRAGVHGDRFACTGLTRTSDGDCAARLA
jgi:hypothetical protein